MILREETICSCSTFSVKSREVIPLVHVLEAGKRIELLDPRLHVMPGDLLPLGDAYEINVLDYALVGLDH